jgi:hypothetical protein
VASGVSLGGSRAQTVLFCFAGEPGEEEMRSVVRVAALALAVGIMAGSAWAQSGPKLKEKASSSKKDTGSKKDPVADAFALPKGVTLRSDQQGKYDTMKKEMEPKLRDTLSQVEAATGAEKDKAAKGVMIVRKEIKTKIGQILREPDPNLAKAAKNVQPKKNTKKKIY